MPLSVMTSATVLSTNVGGFRAMPPRLIVIHTTESHEEDGEARDIAHYFADPATDASSHLVVDNRETIRCVPDNRIAYTALGANTDGLHIEICGKSGQGAKGWADDFSQAALRRAAAAAAVWSKAYGIPLRKLSSADVKAGKRGVCGHVNVTEAYHRSTHTDPGPAFPWALFLDLAKGTADDMDWTDPLDNRVTGKKSQAGNLIEQTYANTVDALKLLKALADPGPLAAAIAAALPRDAVTVDTVAEGVKKALSDLVDGAS